ncbi:MAG: DUF2849 domain-containing protein [Phyllobacteriaceae bacterium]|nr:DUF2849 domain-containing protein [Phyllobacteriaceae bacterium]
MQVLTANRLIDGEAVWLAADHSWTDTIDAADIARDANAAQRLADIGEASRRANAVVDVNLIDIDLIAGRIAPKRLRERIRASGPTNRPDLGKQARPLAAIAA